MTVDDAINQVTAVFRNVLDDDRIVLAYATSARDIEDWDSLTHIELVVGIEKSFGLKFTLGEVQSFKNVGEMCDCIVLKKAG